MTERIKCPKCGLDGIVRVTDERREILGVLLECFNCNAKWNDIKMILIDFLQTNGPMTRPELVELTGIPRTTLFDNLQQLIFAGSVRTYTRPQNGRGRPPTWYKLM